MCKFASKRNGCQKKWHVAKDFQVKLEAGTNTANGGKAMVFSVCRSCSEENRVQALLQSHCVNEKNSFKILVKLNQPIIINVVNHNESIDVWHKGMIAGIKILVVQVIINDVPYEICEQIFFFIKEMFGRKVAKMEHEAT